MSNKWFIGCLLLAVALALTVPVCAQAQNGSKENKEKDAKAPAKSPSEEKPKPATEDPGYIIGAEDVLNISVWKEPQLSNTVPVRPDGKITVPLINDVQAVGLTPMQLAMSITEKLKKYVTDPQVTVIVTAINSRRIYIVGEVNRAGAFALLPGMTVLQALSSAGGFSQFADLKNIYILRVENNKTIRLPFNYKDVIKGNRPEQNILLKPGDTVVVP
jgi:polysaccharide export outer membrane protein